MKIRIPEIAIVLAVVTLFVAIVTDKYNRTSERRDTEAKRIVTLVTNGVTVKTKLPSLSEDFFMGSWTAVSNATRAMQPPEGWSVVCDDEGHYAARSPYGTVLDLKNDAANAYVRTNYFEAVVVAWRTKEIWDTPTKTYELPRSGFSWKECDK